MVGFDDAAMMGLGAANAGVQIYGQQVQKRQQGKLDKMSKEQARRHHAEEMHGYQLQKEDTDRQAQGVGGHSAQQTNSEDANDRGVYNGSQRGVDSGLIEGERQRRQTALDRQITLANSDWMDQERAWKIQKKMAKTAQITGMISTMLLQGGSGVGGAMGGSTMAGG